MPQYRVTYQGAPGNVREVWLGMGPARPIIAQLSGGVPTILDLSERQAASLAAKPWATVEPVTPKRTKGGE